MCKRYKGYHLYQFTQVVSCRQEIKPKVLLSTVFVNKLFFPNTKDIAKKETVNTGGIIQPNNATSEE